MNHRRRHSIDAVVVLIAGLLLMPGGRWAAGAGLEAEMVIYNGKILTADSSNVKNYRTVQAAAVYDGKFVAVGSNDEALQYAGPSTKKIDLGGRTVIPGLVETHDHIYGGADHFMPPGTPRVEVLDPPIRYTSKPEFLAQIKTRILAKKPGEWLVTMPRGNFQDLQKGEVTRFDLDKVAPNNPVHIHWLTTVDGLVNSKALAPLLERYPKISGVYRDSKGVPTGRLSGLANPAMLYEFIPEVPPAPLGPYYRMEMEEIAAQGITTVSTRLSPNHLAVYSWLHAQDDGMPVRMAFTIESLSRSQDTEAIASRIVGLQGGSGKDIWGIGDNKLWAIGVTPDSLDATMGPGGSCIRAEYPREAPNFPQWRFQNYGPHGICRLQDPNYRDINVVQMAAAHGFRISGMHVGGDKALDEFMDAIEQVAKQYPDISERRWAVDHCQIVHADQIERAKKLGLTFSCAPKYLYGGEKSGVGASKILYGEEDASNSVIPFRSMIDQGVPAVIQLDQHAFHPFLALQVVVNRKDMTGKVWGPKQRISREEALYAYTRWSSKYVLKENQLGSIEPKKQADFVVLNRDYLTVPEDEIGRIDPVLTVMDGKVTYSDPQFASAQALPVVGYQGDRSRWWRGTPEDATKGGGGGGE